ncbi:hypothetical protein N7465_010520 [Penicillium sp. CMV-2018d]|nr:hypothetical protein N7465_010520 [Penicillium sp. CMV-2018d]
MFEAKQTDSDMQATPSYRIFSEQILKWIYEFGGKYTRGEGLRCGNDVANGTSVLHSPRLFITLLGAALGFSSLFGVS